MLAGLKKTLLMGLGHFFLILGIIGIVVPGLPTTPFLLLAGYFYSKGSERFHHWLLAHPRLGPPVQAWRAHGVVSRRSKVIATAFILINGVVIVVVIQTYWWAKALALGCLLGVLVFLWTRPSRC